MRLYQTILPLNYDLLKWLELKSLIFSALCSFVLENKNHTSIEQGWFRETSSEKLKVQKKL